VSGIVASFANIFWGWFYDRKQFSRPTVAKITWGLLSVSMLAILSWQVANEHLYANASPAVTLDWDKPGFGRGFASVVLIR
jgi:hypothetical protein